MKLLSDFFNNNAAEIIFLEKAPPFVAVQCQSEVNQSKWLVNSFHVEPKKTDV